MTNDDDANKQATGSQATHEQPSSHAPNSVLATLVPADGVRVRAGGRILIGGAPLRIMRLTSPGAQQVRSWFGGLPVSETESHQALAWRLVDAGIAHPALDGPAKPRPDDQPEETTPPLGVVVPVKDDQDGLNQTLGSLGNSNVVVVDDGSEPPMQLPPSSPESHVLLRQQNAGPAAARNAGLARIGTDRVAFVDAGVLVTEETLSQLSLQLDSLGLDAVAPRVVPNSLGAMASVIDRYESFRSPLDLGPTPSDVRPGSLVAYLPTACLVVKTGPLSRIGGFDEALRYGEDVDLIWRLGEDGRVRYSPNLTVEHPARGSVGAFCRQRIGYGSAAAPLSQRHPTATAPVRTSGWSLAVAGLLGSGHPVLALLLGGGTAAALVPKLRPLPDAEVEAALLTARGHGWTIRSFAANSIRTWWPLTVLAILTGVGRRAALGAAALGWVQRVADRPPSSGIDLALGPLDDLSYGLGVWRGVVEHRTLRPLLPHVISWP